MMGVEINDQRKGDGPGLQDGRMSSPGSECELDPKGQCGWTTAQEERYGSEKVFQ